MTTPIRASDAHPAACQHLGGLHQNLPLTATAPRSAKPIRRARRAGSLESIGIEKQAEFFAGLPDGVKHHDQLLETFKAAAPALHIPKCVVELLDTLVRRTQLRDWHAGSRPLVWPSNQELMLALGRNPTAIGDAIRFLVKHGLIVMKDSPSGKRYGGRDQHGAIIEGRTFGFDLSPLVLRYAEFKAIGERARVDHRTRMEARRQVTREREALFQIIDTAAELELWSTDWAQAAKRAEDTRSMVVPTLGLAETQHLVRMLAKWRLEAREMLEAAVQNLAAAAETVCGTKNETDSWLSENRQLKNTTTLNPSIDLSKCSVTAQRRECSSEGSAQRLPDAPVAPVVEPTMSLVEIADIEAKGITPTRIADFCPVIGAIVGPDPTWRDVGEACKSIAANYEMSHRTWARAVTELGPQHSIVAFAILASLPRDRFTKGPGAYFAGMVKAHRQGRLNLIGSFHGMRERADEGTCPSAPPDRKRSAPDRRAVGNLAAGLLAKLKRGIN
jgi:replication initiation protein RepC